MPFRMEVFKRYGERYGYVSLPARFLGRKCPFLWRYIGRISTKGVINRRFARADARILNLGSGSHLIDACLNADIDPRADVFVDARRPLPFSDASVDDIFSEEMIEHISETEALSLVRECFRILKPGGRIRISTPDLDYFAERVANVDSLGAHINAIFYEHGHRYLFTRRRLRGMIAEAGFIDVTESRFQDPSSELARFDSHATRFSHEPEISQFVEARKPFRST